MAWLPADTRYDSMPYKRCGRSGLTLPRISLGFWWNFGHDDPYEKSRRMCLRAFDLGIAHFDLANGYGPPRGAAEETVGQLLKTDLRDHRDELIISTKAGWQDIPGPLNNGGNRKYVVASLDRSLKRLGLDYVDIYYVHRFDPDTPMEETMAAFAHCVRQGKALYVGVSGSYDDPALTREAHRLLGEMGVPLLIHQPAYSMMRRTIEQNGLLETLDELGVGCIVFSALAQGMLTAKYLDGVPADSRKGRYPDRHQRIDAAGVEIARRLNAIALARGQSLAQMALAWVLRKPQTTSALIGVSRVEQIEDNLGALANLHFDDEELRAIDAILAD